MFGPFWFVHTTYASDIKLSGNTNTPQYLSILRDMVYYNGMWYGDWSVFPTSTFEAEPGLQKRHLNFDMTKATIPEDIKRRLTHEQ